MVSISLVDEGRTIAVDRSLLFAGDLLESVTRVIVVVWRY